MSNPIHLVSCCLSEQEKHQALVNRSIERMIIREKMHYKREIKLLLLGPGESGKSTFLKQMKIIHGSGFPPKERQGYINVAYQNACLGMQMIIKAMQKLGIQFTSSYAASRAAEFMEEHFSLHSKYRERYLEILITLWKDPGCKECFQQRHKFHLPESAIHFLPKLEKIVQTNYNPTDEDIIHSRCPTTSIDEYCIGMSGRNFRIVDVGGQRSERQKWLHCFEKVTAVLFLAAVSEYDQYLIEQEKQNRLCESIDLFEVIISSKYFQKSSIILFLNKVDVLEEKIYHIALKDYFQDFEGEENDIESAKEYIVHQFQAVNQSEERIIYSHFTCATVGLVSKGHPFHLQTTNLMTQVMSSWLKMERMSLRNQSHHI